MSAEPVPIGSIGGALDPLPTKAERLTFQKYTDSGKVGVSDDYGEIQFVGKHRGSTSKFIRVLDNTDPGKLRCMIEREWGVRKPGVVISVTGGANTLGLSNFMVRNIKKGLMEGALKTNAWVTTGGTDNGEYGVMRLVGEAASEAGGQVPVFGVATWDCIEDNQQLMQSNSMKWYSASDATHHRRSTYQKRSQLTGKSAFLDSNHGYFVLVDSGEQRWGGENQLRAKLEQSICHPGAAWVVGRERTAVGGNTWEMAARESPASANYLYHTPDRQSIHEVVVAIGGGPNTIIQLKDAVAKNMPTIVVNKSGRAGSLISLAKNLYDLHSAQVQGFDREEFGKLLRGVEPVRSQLSAEEVDLFHKILRSEFRTPEKRDEAVQNIIDVAMHPLVFIYEANSSDADLAATMMRAIMESKRLANEDDLLTWLIESMYLAIKWNFLTVAMNDILPELSKLDHGDFHRIFADGLQYALETNNADFVHFFLSTGVDCGSLNLNALYELAGPATGTEYLEDIMGGEFVCEYHCDDHPKVRKREKKKLEREGTAKGKRNVANSPSFRATRPSSSPTKPDARVRAVRMVVGPEMAKFFPELHEAQDPCKEATGQDVLVWAILMQRVEIASHIIHSFKDNLRGVLLGFAVLHRIQMSNKAMEFVFGCKTQHRARGSDHK
jgi:hypothetical protein